MSLSIGGLVRRYRGDLALVSKPGDLERLLSSERIGILMSLEGADPIRRSEAISSMSFFIAAVYIISATSHDGVWYCSSSLLGLLKPGILSIASSRSFFLIA